MSHAYTGGDVGAVGRAVHDGSAGTRVIEHRDDVIDHLLDSQRLRRQVGAGVVVAGQTDSPVLDHDHVQPDSSGAPSKPLVEQD